MGIRVGQKPEFDQAVARKILEIISSSPTPMVFSHILRDLNGAPDLVMEHPQKLFTANTGPTGYAYRIIDALEQEGLLATTRQQTRFSRKFRTKDALHYGITDTGRDALSHEHQFCFAGAKTPRSP